MQKRNELTVGRY